MSDSNKLNDPARPQPGPHLQSDSERTHNLGRLQTDLQIDPELAEGPASRGRVVAYGVAIVVVLSAVVYGLNSTKTTQESSSPTATQSTPVAATPSRSGSDSASTPPTQKADETAQQPATNSAPGTTTGAAPAIAQAPKSAPTGTEVDRSNRGDAPASK